MSAIIQFRSGKTKTKVFAQDRSGSSNPDTSVLFDKKTAVLDRLSQEERTEESRKPTYKNSADVFRDLSDRLMAQYGIDAVSVYQRTEKNNDGKIHFRRNRLFTIADQQIFGA